MNRTFIKAFGILAAFALVGFFVSCQEEEMVAADVDNFVLQSTQEIEERCAAGSAGCYEFVFPVTLQFADSTTATVNDYIEMRQAIRDWFMSNSTRPRPWNRPTLVFPIQVMNEAGEIITVETQLELRELIAECRLGNGGPGNGGPGNGGPGHGGPGHGWPGNGGPGHGGPGNGGQGPCFTLDFPVTVQFPDSTLVTAESPIELREAIQEWNMNHPGQHVRPQFVFPITVILQDGTEVVVNSREELRALKLACRG